MSSGFDTGSGTPPLDFTEFYAQRRAALREEQTRASLTLADYSLRNADAALHRGVYPKRAVGDFPRQTLRTDMLSAYTPRPSAGDAAFARLHHVNVWDDPNLSHSENEAIFRGEGMPRSQYGGYMAPGEDAHHYDNLAEENDDAAELIEDLAVLFDCSEEEIATGIVEASKYADLTIEETLGLLLPEVNALVEAAEQLGCTPSDIVEACTTEDDDELTDVNEELREYAREVLDEIRAKLHAKRGVKFKTDVKKSGVTFNDPAPAPTVKFSGITGTSASKKRKTSSGIVGEGLVAVDERLARLLRG